MNIKKEQSFYKYFVNLIFHNNIGIYIFNFIKYYLFIFFVIKIVFCNLLQTQATYSETITGNYKDDVIKKENTEIIVVSTSIVDMDKKNYTNNVVLSISENITSQTKEKEQIQKIELLNEELEITNLNNLIVNNSNQKIFIYEEDNVNSKIIGILNPNAVGEAEDIRTFETELDRFIAGDAEWLKIKSGDVYGYIQNKNILHSQEAINKLNELYNTTAKVISNNKVYIRREANIESDAITYVRYGAYLKVDTDKYDINFEWIPVILDDEAGFVKAESVELINRVDYAVKYEEFISTSKGAKVIIPPTEETPSAVVDFACQFIGNPYVWGGTSLTNGCDCSGFVMKVYEYFGVKLPHSSYLDRSVGISVPYDEIQPGDIVCYDGHVGIYSGGGKIVNALNKRNGITLTNVNYDTILSIRRVLNSETMEEINNNILISEEIIVE